MTTNLAFPLLALSNSILMGPNGLAQGLQIFQGLYLSKPEADMSFVFGCLFDHFLKTGKVADLANFSGFGSEEEARIHLGELSQKLDCYRGEDSYETKGREFAIQMEAFSPVIQRPLTQKLFGQVAFGNRLLPQNLTGPSRESLLNSVARTKRDTGELAEAFTILNEVPKTGLQGVKALLLQAHILWQLGRVEGAETYLNRAEELMTPEKSPLNLQQLSENPELMYPEEKEILFNFLRIRVSLLQAKNDFKTIVNLLIRFQKELPQDLILERAIALKLTSRGEEASQELSSLIAGITDPVEQQNFVDLFEQNVDIRNRYKIREFVQLSFNELVLTDFFDLLFFGETSPKTSWETLDRLQHMRRYHDLLDYFTSEDIMNAINGYRAFGDPVTPLMVVEGNDLTPSRFSEEIRSSDRVHEDFVPDFLKGYQNGNRLVGFYSGFDGALVTDCNGKRGKVFVKPYGDFASNGRAVFVYRSSDSLHEEENAGYDPMSVVPFLSPSLDVTFVSPKDIQLRLTDLRETIFRRIESDLLHHKSLKNVSQEERDRILGIIKNPLWSDEFVVPLAVNSQNFFDVSAQRILIKKLWKTVGTPYHIVSRDSEWPIKAVSRDYRSRFFFYPKIKESKITPEMRRAVRVGKDDASSRYFSKIEVLKQTGTGSMKYVKDFNAKEFRLQLGPKVWGFVVPYEDENVPYAIRIQPELKDTVAGELVRYHEAVHVLDQLVFKRRGKWLHRRRYMTEAEQLAYTYQGEMFQSLNLTANDLRWMEIELVSKGVEVGAAKKLVTSLAAPFWVEDVETGVQEIIQAGAVLDFNS